MWTTLRKHGWELWGYNFVQDDRSDFTQSRPLYGDAHPSGGVGGWHVARSPPTLSRGMY